MKQLISDWILTPKPESVKAVEPSPTPVGTYSEGKIVSDDGALLLLIYLYLELRLNLEQAIRAAQADLVMAPTGQNPSQWVEQPAAAHR